jgi:SAM-dependent methyltransferase
VPKLLKKAAARIEWLRLWAGGRAAALIPFVGSGRLLDVGCGVGQDLGVFKDAGWQLTGVELSGHAAAVARRRLGCEVLVGRFEDARLGEQQFDVVRFAHSLEHLASPRAALEKAYRLLRPGGLLWIEVPNAASVDRRIFGIYWCGWRLPRHLYHFTPSTLTHLVRECGFRPRQVTCDGRMSFFAESLAEVLNAQVRLRQSIGKDLAVLARPLVYALGMLNRGVILTIHAERAGGPPGADLTTHTLSPPGGMD